MFFKLLESIVHVHLAVCSRVELEPNSAGRLALWSISVLPGSVVVSPFDFVSEYLVGLVDLLELLLCLLHVVWVLVWVVLQG